MSNWNMPPGVSTSDIPGNGPEYCEGCGLPTPEEELEFNGGLCELCRRAADEHYKESVRDD